MGAVLIFFILSFTSAQLFSSVISVNVPFEYNVVDSNDGRRKFTSEHYIDATMYGKHPLKQRERLKALITHLGDDDDNIVKKTYKFVYTKPTGTQGEHDGAVTMEANQKLARILQQYILEHNRLQNADLTEMTAGKINDANIKEATRTSHGRHRLYNIAYNFSNGNRGLIYEGFNNKPFGLDMGGKYEIHKDLTVEKNTPDKENNPDIDIFMKDTNYQSNKNNINDMEKSNLFKVDLNKTTDGANMGVVEIIDAQKVPKQDKTMIIDKEEDASAVDEVITVKPNNGSMADDIDKRNPIEVTNNQTQKVKAPNDRVSLIDLEPSIPESNTNQEILGVVPIVPKDLNHTKSSNETNNKETDIIPKTNDRKGRNPDKCLSKSCKKGIKNKVIDVIKRIPQHLKRNVCELAKLNLDNFWELMSRYLGLEKGYKEDLNVIVQLNIILSIFTDLKEAADAGIPINQMLKIITQTLRSRLPEPDILDASTSKNRDYVINLLKIYSAYSPENIKYLNKNVPKTPILPADDLKSKPGVFIQFPNAIDSSTVQYNYLNFVPKKGSGLFRLKGELNIENYPAKYQHNKQRPNKKRNINKHDIKAEDYRDKPSHDITMQQYKKNYTNDVDNTRILNEVQNHKYIPLPHNTRGQFNNYYSREISPHNDGEMNLKKFIHLMYKFDDNPNTSEDVRDQREIAYDSNTANQNIREEQRNNPFNLNAYQLALYNANPGYLKYMVPYPYEGKDTDVWINLANKLNVFTPQREKEHNLIGNRIEGMPVVYNTESDAYNVPNAKAEEELKQAIGINGEDMQQLPMLQSTRDNDAVKQLFLTADEVQRTGKEFDPSQTEEFIPKESIRVGQKDTSDAMCSPR